MKSKVVFSIFIAIALGVSLVFYVKSGGFAEVKIDVSKKNEFYIYGKEFKGLLFEADYKRFVKETHNEITEMKIDGNSVFCFYDNPNISFEEEKRAVMGLEIKDTLRYKVQNGFKIYKIKEQEFVVGSFDHQRIAPPANKTYEDLKKYCEKSKKEMKGPYIEKVNQNQSVESWIGL